MTIEVPRVNVRVRSTRLDSILVGAEIEMSEKDIAEAIVLGDELRRGKPPAHTRP